MYSTAGMRLRGTVPDVERLPKPGGGARRFLVAVPPLLGVLAVVFGLFVLAGVARFVVGSGGALRDGG